MFIKQGYELLQIKADVKNLIGFSHPVLLYKDNREDILFIFAVCINYRLNLLH